ncbi:hypothetical protein EXIGLDRAFT_837384 [Exidia glandulosa HHB12029]|uniref:RING-type domain-containing protein n=1 Tax=Exidia glandulosa HHB12029 TaxID=1314781 RepID=A0A165GW44_EXIGL|nr:hypothetical protein EXIGLDRAFT_837384 [Exidia glandulosa HHB12029]
MGNTASTRDKHDDSVDYGALVPFGVYSGQQDWNHAIVTQLVVDRRLAPFYRPLEDYDDSWDDDRILAARKELPPADTAQQPASASDSGPPSAAPSVSHSAHSSLSKFSKHHSKQQQQQSETSKFSEAVIYKGAVECPICLLYYPPNINRSRCCDQAICTECFVQIKRAEPTTTHLVSEPAACPYCVRENFGVVYTPPPWRAGIGADSSSASSSRPELSKVNSGSSSGEGESATRRGKRKSYSHTSPEVVTVDQIRPDWEAKLNAVRAAVTRRANRRIIMRQVGDRLIPVGVTSGRVHANGTQLGDGGGVVLAEAPTPPEGGRSGRRGPRNQELSQLLGGLTIGGQDLEELMVMEAMRLSLLEHEEQQRRERDAANRAGTSSSSAGDATSSSPVAITAPRRSAPPSHQGSPLPPSSIPGTSPGSRQAGGVLASALGRAALSGALAIGLPSGDQPSRQETPRTIPLDLPVVSETVAVPAAAETTPEPAAIDSTPSVPAVAAIPVPAVSHLVEEPAVESTSSSVDDSTATDIPTTPSSIADDTAYQHLLSYPPTSASDSMPLLPTTSSSPESDSHEHTTPSSPHVALPSAHPVPE